MCPLTLLQSVARIGSSLIFLLGVACCSIGEETSIAEAAVMEFHGRLKAGQMDLIYESATEEFKKSSSKEDILRFLDGIRSKLGAANESRKLHWQVGHKQSGNIVTLTYATRFSSGDVTEHFVYRFEDTSAKLLGYRIDSVKAITD